MVGVGGVYGRCQGHLWSVPGEFMVGVRGVMVGVRRVMRVKPEITRGSRLMVCVRGVLWSV